MEKEYSKPDSEAERNEGSGQFVKLLKIGVYKELHKRGMLSDMQLNALIKLQNIC